jgi:hypothetical protein
VDAHRGFIVDAEVIRDTSEQLETAPMVDRIAANLGEKPKSVLADGLHATGENMRDSGLSLRLLRGLSVGQRLPEGERPPRAFDLPRCA